MNALEYQLLANRTAAGDPVTLTPEQVELLNWTTGLTGEAGEVSDHIKKAIFHGQGIDPEHLKRELGDVLWYIAAFCHTMDFTLEEIMETNIEKLKKRFPDGFSFERSTFREEADTAKSQSATDAIEARGLNWYELYAGQIIEMRDEEDSAWYEARIDSWHPTLVETCIVTCIDPRSGIQGDSMNVDRHELVDPYNCRKSQKTSVMPPTLQTLPDHLGSPGRSLQARSPLRRETFQGTDTRFYIIGQDGKEYPAIIREYASLNGKEEVVVERGDQPDPLDPSSIITLYRDTLDADKLFDNPTFAYYGR